LLSTYRFQRNKKRKEKEKRKGADRNVLPHAILVHFMYNPLASSLFFSRLWENIVGFRGERRMIKEYCSRQLFIIYLLYIKDI
jgi:hypothetical protein